MNPLKGCSYIKIKHFFIIWMYFLFFSLFPKKENSNNFSIKSKISYKEFYIILNFLYFIQLFYLLKIEIRKCTHDIFENSNTFKD